MLPSLSTVEKKERGKIITSRLVLKDFGISAPSKFALSLSFRIVLLFCY